MPSGPVYTCACGDMTAELRCPTCGRATTLDTPERRWRGLRPGRRRAFREDKPPPVAPALTANTDKRSIERGEDA